MAMIAVTDRYARVSKADDESKNLVSLLWFGIITEWQCFERGRPVEPCPKRPLSSDGRRRSIQQSPNSCRG